MTLRSLQDTSIEDYGYQLGRHWDWRRSRNTGALLIVAPNERKVRIEVGYGLEGTLTDAVTRLIIQNAILPRFRANDCGGSMRGVDDIIQVVSGDAEEYKRRAAQRPESWRKASTSCRFILFAVCHFRDIPARCETQTPGGGGAATRRGELAGPIFIPSGGSWSSGSSGSRRKRNFRRRRVVRRRRFFGQLVMTPLGPRSRAHRRSHPAGGNAHVRRNLLRFHPSLERLPSFSVRLVGRVLAVLPLPLIYLTAWPAGVIYALQLAMFLGALYCLTRESVRYLIVPRQTKPARAHQEALRQFAAHGLSIRVAHRRSHLRVRRRAICGDSRRRRHRSEGES